MDLKALNKKEWENPDNWSRRGMFGIYFSKKDTRWLVPKATPALGWTLNFGHRNSIFALAVVLVLPVIGLVIALALQNRL